jgi:uncharacterized protein (DUF302 family)
MGKESIMATTARYGIRRTVKLPYDLAVERAREALTKEGFGVLTEIDVRATLKKRIGVDFRPYIILGACNPPLAHRALEAELDIGLLLPCNVIVYAGKEEGTSIVAALDPEAALSMSDTAGVRDVATEVRARLDRVVADIAEE